ncbi:MAG: hypothetical protein E6G07_10745 [Actinobacteria bacterium]|nr:MAG: hypothetical protein E6G07_10745 [Actinomycetota bacterium]
MDRAQFEAAIGPISTRQEFLEELRTAIDEGTGYATGKLGNSEQSWLRYPEVLSREPPGMRRRAFEVVLAYKSLPTTGIFPAEPEFLRRWSSYYVERVKRLDAIGLFENSYKEYCETFKFHGVSAPRFMLQHDQQPDRSSPHDESRCYLPFLRGRDVLLISPFAGTLAERANEETFERVWAKTGKPWFHPRSVDAVENPYGFARETQAVYPTALDLLADLARQIEARDFDVALIAAGGLGIPLASIIKEQDRVAISLGGHLQIVFGVLGGRWRSNERWQRRYFNEAWIDMPEQYVPDYAETVLDDYW